jgi:hypothetical protein
MMRKLIIGVFVTAVAALPVAARADWDSLKTDAVKAKDDAGHAKDAAVKTKSETVKVKNETVKTYDRDRDDLANRRTDALKTDATDLGDKGKTVQKKTVTTYKKGRDYAKRTTNTKTTTVDKK